MMHIPITRILAAFAIIGLCALALLRGWDIVRFSVAEANLGSDENRSKTLHPWLNVPGLAFAARQSALSAVVEWSDKSAAIRRRDEQMEILAVRPLSPDYWLLLSDMRLVTGEDPNKVVQALDISALIGSNEGYLMDQRGMFAVSIWEMLPLEAKQRGARDIAAIKLSDIQKGRFREILSEKSDSVREDIKHNLKADRKSTRLNSSHIQKSRMPSSA